MPIQVAIELANVGAQFSHAQVDVSTEVCEPGLDGAKAAIRLGLPMLKVGLPPLKVGEQSYDICERRFTHRVELRRTAQVLTNGARW